ncbi:MAG: CBS domain-containing protein [Proteobacteria bacterium]|nr:CBS domain-containing protein [Pseudomonadota bacterium]
MGRPADIALEQGGTLRQGDLAGLLRRSPVSVQPEASVRDALGRMKDERVGTVVITEPVRGLPLGILTRQDVIDRVVLPGGGLG